MGLQTDVDTFSERFYWFSMLVVRDSPPITMNSVALNSYLGFHTQEWFPSSWMALKSNWRAGGYPQGTQALTYGGFGQVYSTRIHFHRKLLVILSILLPLSWLPMSYPFNSYCSIIPLSSSYHLVHIFLHLPFYHACPLKSFLT